ncbi:MAG: insulinase family protein [Chlamydiota bacterium]|jgi:insulysin
MIKKLLVILTAVLSLCAGSPDYVQVMDRSNLNIATPSLKNRKIEKIRLVNGLSVYLVSDPDTDQSAAALAVNAGSWNDPKNFPGMAHFLEHMLFMGNKAYPDENEFFNFVSDHAGSVNAYTSSDRTVYMFSINNDALTGALDRFSHFFIDPLFSQKAVNKELFVVDQEHEKNIENDHWRLYMISKEIGNQNHPNAKFSTGNSKTLSKIPEKTMRNWFENNYSANLMHLVVYSSKPMDELKTLVAEKFSPIPNRALDRLYIDQPLTSAETKKTITYVKPIKKINQVLIEFELPKEFASDDSKSAKLIAYALRRGQKNSLEQVLVKKGLIEKLDVFAEKVGTHHLLFQIEIDLTEKGLSEVESVLQLSFESIEQLKKGGIPSYLFDEMQKMASLEYMYQQREDAFSFVRSYAHHMIDEPLSTFPQNTILASQNSPEKVQKILQFLSLNNAQIYILSDPKNYSVLLDKKEKWMQANYTTKELSSKQLTKIRPKKVSNELRIAPPNPFMPTNLQLITLEKTGPFILVDDQMGRIYLMQDDKFLTPEVSIHLHILSPYLKEDTKSLTLADIFLEHINQILDPILTSAQSANLSANFSVDRNRFNINIEGFSEKAPLLIEEILKEITHTYPSKETFLQFKDLLEKKYANADKELPIKQAMGILSSILLSDQKTPQEHLKALSQITYDDYLEFQNRIFRKTFIEGFLAGNLTIKEAEDIWTDVRHLIGYQSYNKNSQQERKIYTLNSDSGPYKMQYSTESSGTGVILAIDLGSFSFKNRASQEILSSVIQDSFFNELRTKQKTGYIVSAFPLEKDKRLFLNFAVQSSTHEPQDLLYRYELFLETFIHQLPEEVSPERFENIRQNKIIKLQNSMKNLSIKASTLDKLAFEYQDLQWIEKRIHGLQELTYKEFQAFATKVLSKNNRKRLGVLMKGKQPDDAFIYEDVNANKLVDIGEYTSAEENDELVLDSDANSYGADNCFQ